jgi:hypothetical protein
VKENSIWVTKETKDNPDRVHKVRARRVNLRDKGRTDSGKIRNKSAAKTLTSRMISSAVVRTPTGTIRAKSGRAPSSETVLNQVDVV